LRIVTVKITSLEKPEAKAALIVSDYSKSVLSEAMIDGRSLDPVPLIIAAMI
jgi:hypothetical protein